MDLENFFCVLPLLFRRSISLQRCKVYDDTLSWSWIMKRQEYLNRRQTPNEQQVSFNDTSDRAELWNQDDAAAFDERNKGGCVSNNPEQIWKSLTTRTSNCGENYLLWKCLLFLRWKAHFNFNNISMSGMEWRNWTKRNQKHNDWNDALLH